MSIIHLRSIRDGTGAADRPMAEPSGSGEQVLFREAKRRERRRRAAALGVVLALAGLVSGLVFAAGGSPPPRSGSGASSGNTPGPPGAGLGHFAFRGDGIGDARFGQPEAVAIAALDQVLGSPMKPRPTGASGNCTIDSYLTWKMLTAYFFRGHFVGYDSASLLAARGSAVPHMIPSASTAAGLRIGDDIAQARQIYGRAFVVSLAQGGSWRVTTSTGVLDGYLTAAPGGPTSPDPKIADVSAGSVGCPAASP